MSAVTFKITTPHNTGSRFKRHGWFFPNGWRDVGPVENRDRAGRLQGQRPGSFPAWFVLMCINRDCAGRAVVPVKVLTDFADQADEFVGEI